MRKIIKQSLAAMAVSALMFSTACTNEEYDLENIGEDGFNIHTSLAAPICHSHSTFANIFNAEGIKGKLITVDKGVIDLAATGYGEVDELLKNPLALKVETNFKSQTITDDINFSEIFGDENPVRNLDSLILIIEVSHDVPFDMDLTLDFLKGFDKDDPKVESLNRSVHVPSCAKGDPDVHVVQYLKYGNVFQDIKDVKSILFTMGFTVDLLKFADGLEISADQYVDFKLKAYVEGSINPTDF